MSDKTSEAGLKPDRAQRFAIPMALRYRRRGEKGWRRGKVENVSRTGVLFSARLLMEPGSPVEMKLQLPEEAGWPNPARIFCKGNVVRDPDPTMGGEDFSYMLQQRPGAYIWLGQGGGQTGCFLHNPGYDFNDEIIPLGAGYLAALVEESLPLR